MFAFRSFRRVQSILATLTKSHQFQSLSTSQRIYIVTNKSIVLPQLNFTRSYAKSQKDKLKLKAKNKGVKASFFRLNDERLNEIINVDTYVNKLEKCVATLSDEFIKNLSLRSTTGSIETIKVKFEGEEHELQDIAQIVRKNPKTIVVNMVAFPQAIPFALKSIERSGMNLNPQQDGTTLFIPVPKVTKEHRSNLAKNAKALFHKCKDHIKDAKNDVLRKVKNNKDISADENYSAQMQLTEMAEEYVAKAEKMLAAKENELLGN